MRHRDPSLSAAIFVMVVLVHAGVVVFILSGPRGCQQGMASPLSRSGVTASQEASPIRIDLTLPDRLVQSSGRAPSEEVAEDHGKREGNLEEPASRLTIPVSEKTPDPAIEEAEREAAKLAMEKRQAEEAKAEEAKAELARQVAKEAEDAERRAKEARLARDREAAQERERVLASQRQSERLEKARQDEAERELAEKKKEEEAREAAVVRERERQRQETREMERQRELAAQAEREKARERKRQADAAAKAKAEAQKEKEREVAAAAERERERQAEKAQREREVAAQQEKERNDERLRKEAEAVASRVEKAKVVAEVPVSKAVVKANVLGEAGSGEASSGEGAEEAQGEGGPPAVADMGAYRASVQKMIRNRWSIPRGMVVETHPEVVVRINRAGQVVYSRTNRKSGIPEIDRSAINAVRIGSNLIPLPPGYDKDVYEVTVKFQID